MKRNNVNKYGNKIVIYAVADRPSVQKWWYCYDYTANNKIIIIITLLRRCKYTASEMGRTVWYVLAVYRKLIIMSWLLYPDNYLMHSWWANSSQNNTRAIPPKSRSHLFLTCCRSVKFRRNRSSFLADIRENVFHSYYYNKWAQYTQWLVDIPP